jgi:PKHD-type hydroxylase
MLITIEQVLTKDEVRQFRAHLEHAAWQDGAASGGTLARQVKRNRQVDDSAEVAIQLGNHIVRTIGSHPLFVSAALPRKIYPPRFNRYETDGGYGLHVDSAIMHVPHSHLSVRTDLAATLFLSEPDEYQGGELEIEGEFGGQAIKLNAGDMVLYPASSLHRVAPVTAGARVASFFWVESLVGDAAAPATLFDLDQAIQQLTPLLAADDARLLKLTNVYHNLVRRWATT